MITAGLLAIFVFLLPIGASSQQLAKPVRIGVLTVAWGPPPQLEGLVAGLIDLGYQENQDFVVAVWFTEGVVSALPDAAREMVESGIDILLPVGPLETDAALQATRTRPIVFLRVGDPVGQGLIESFAQPGGNVTGVSDLGFGTAGRRLQLFKELIPGLSRVLFPYNSQDAHQMAEAQTYRSAADRLGITLVERPLGTMEEAIDAMADLPRDDVDGILAPRDAGLNIPGLVVEATLNQNIPSMFDNSIYVEIGGFASYGGPSDEIGWQAARIIDKIIRGTEPSQIPVESTAYFEFVVNLRIAALLGIAIPPVVLFQADRILR